MSLTATLQQLQADLGQSLADERNEREEWKRAEEENLNLRQQLESILQTQLSPSPDTTDGNITTTNTSRIKENDMALLRTHHFIAASSAVLREEFVGSWLKEQELEVARGEEGSFTKGGEMVQSTKDQQDELTWILHTLPTINQSNPPLPIIPPTPTPLPPPFATLDYSVEQMSNEWRALFPSNLLTASSSSSETDLKGWETLVQEIGEAIQQDRTMYDQWTRLQTAARLSSSTSHAASYEFDEPDGPNNIVMESDGGAIDPSSTSAPAIKCATLNKLIQRVTHEQIVDLNTRFVFLLTYHSFTTSNELLEKLKHRFNVPLPTNLSPAELAIFKSSTFDRIQIRVCSVLKNWIDEHWQADFMQDESLTTQLKAFINEILENSTRDGSTLTSQLAKSLQTLINKKEALSASGGHTPMKSTNPTPKLLISSKLSLDHFDLMEIDELELARQLTLLDFAKFRSISPRECLNQNWSRKDKAILAPNILGMIQQFNAVSNWVQRRILLEKELKVRIKVFEKFLKIAERCRTINNFNSLFAIYCGLTANPIHRLKRTKLGLSTKAQKRFDDFVDLFRVDKNHRNFRRVLQSVLPPCIPHLGIFLSDLTFIEDGNPDFLLTHLINFTKRCKLAERIRFIKQYQQEGYQLEAAPVIQQYFQQQWSEEMDAEALWKLSKEIEPTIKE